MLVLNLTCIRGSLKPTKYFWYTLHWLFDHGVTYLKSAKSINMDVLIEDFTEMDKPIEKLNSMDTKELMGFFQFPLGTMNGQIIKYPNSINSWSTLLTNGYLHRRLVWKDFWCTLWASIKCSLPEV